MKKILLIVVLILVGLNAQAWSSRQDEGVVLLAAKYLSPEAKGVVERYLGTTYSDDVAYLVNLEKKGQSPYSKEVHYLHLNADLQPMAVEGDDALKALEQALAVVAAHESHPKGEVVRALRIIINLMCDIHTPSHIRIEGVQHSWHDFNVCRYAAASGSKAKIISRSKWSSFWSVYSAMHNGFHAELWAEDLDVCFGAKRAEISHGTLLDWVQQNGRVASKLYGVITPERTLSRVEFLRLENVNCEMMASAGLRLATLLNGTIK